MRIVFFGASAFALPALEALQDSGHSILAVVTQPARPRGRGRRVEPGPVEAAAQRTGLKVLTPGDPNNPEALRDLSELRPELGVLVSYGCIIKQELLELPSRGFINVHPSLLPAYRGAAPIQRALMDGATQTGISIIRMNRRIDAGDLILQHPVPIQEDETFGELSPRLARTGAELLIRAISGIEHSTARYEPQDTDRASSAPKILDHERVIDWTEPAWRLHNLVRALSPEPAARTFFRSRRLLILRSAADTTPVSDAPGTIIHDRPGIAVATGRGILTLLQLKPESGRAQTGAEFRNGCRLVPDERFFSKPQTGD